MSSHARIHRQGFRVLIVLLSVVLAVTGVEVLVPRQPAVAAETKLAGPAVLERADVQAASLLARVKNKRVEVTGARTEDTTTWANPDGSMTESRSQAPVRVAQPDGSWRDVDLSLKANIDGTVEPASSARPFTLAKAASGDGWHSVVSAGSGTKKLEWMWDGPLPAPLVDGYTATYPDVAKDVDLQVSSQTSGFEISFVIKKRPAGPVALPLTVRAGSAFTINEERGGAFEAVDGKGHVVAKSLQPSMWDAKAGAETGSADGASRRL